MMDIEMNVVFLFGYGPSNMDWADYIEEYISKPNGWGKKI